ncbi:MAG: copper-binding protein [Burkholderiales bacterium]
MLRPFAFAIAFAGLVAGAFGPAVPAHAQAAQSTASAQAEGEVRKVEPATGKVVIKHGPLTTLNMPPMTMEFTAKDPKLLAGLKVGDKVRFTPEQGKDGTLLVTAITPVRN